MANSPAKIENREVDILVIGGGPAGLTAGLYAARAGRRTIVLEGRSPSLLDLDYTIENYPGFVSISSRDLLQKFRRHAEHFGAGVIDAEVIDMSLATDPKFVATSVLFIQAKAVIIASGKPLSKSKMIPGEESLVGMGVSYCATCDGPLYKDRPVAAVGLGDEAAEDVLALHQLGCRVSWFPSSGDKEPASKALMERVEKLGIAVFPEAQVREIKGRTRVEGLTVERKGRSEDIEAAAVFIFREIPTGPLFAKAGVELDHKQCIKVDRFQRTNLEGVFAAGDVTCGGMQVVSGAGEGAVAAVQAVKFLRKAAE